MTVRHCPAQERLLRHVDRDLSARDADAVAAHLAQCALCRAQVEALNHVVGELRQPLLAGFDPTQHARSVIARLPDRAPERGARRRPWGWAIALACAAGVLTLSRSTWSPVNTWQARGGTRVASIARDVGVQLYEAEPAPRALTPNAAISASAPLTAGYRNLGNQTAYLLLFAVDRAGEIHWIAPPYTQAASDPGATEVPPNREEQLLPYTVQFDDLSPGALRVMTVVTRESTHVSDIESLAHSGEMSAQSITSALPEAEVRELRLRVEEVSR